METALLRSAIHLRETRRRIDLSALCLAMMAFVLVCPRAHAQTSAWVWMGGSQTLGLPPVFGTQGVAAPANTPGGRDGAYTWTDQNGNLWLFGGGVSSSSYGIGGLMNDIWRFDPNTLEWTWMGGSKEPWITWAQSKAYGTKGVPSSTNFPMGRGSGLSWTDSNGNFWLFGGSGYPAVSQGFEGELNDLWEYNPSTAEWTWVSGTDASNQPGTYGTLGAAAAGNFPGGRYMATGWIDAQNNLWVFGGQGCDVLGCFFELNDLWKYDPATNEWTWMAGSNTGGEYAAQSGAPGQYGVLGTPSAENSPGDRLGAMGGADANGNLWLFGGLGCDSKCSWGTLNDLWEYSPSLQQWAWMGGASVLPVEFFGVAGVFGTQGVPSLNNYPGSRDEGIMWTDANGHLGMFGGYAIDSVDHLGTPDDMWDFDPGTQEWTWESGSNVITPYVNDGSVSPTVYGMLGVPTPGATPGGRYQSQMWTRSDGTVWLFGGNTSDDMWVYGPQTASPTFSLPAGTYAGVQSITISDSTPSSTIYYTTDGSMPTTSSPQYSTAVTLNQHTDTLQAIATAPGILQSYVSSASYTLNLPPAATPVIALAPGAYPAGQTASITDSTGGSSIYYTVDGTTPTVNSPLYGGPITLPFSGTLQAFAIATGYSYSPVASVA
jgi:N-acetylneuraminic acid mutarotase